MTRASRATARAPRTTRTSCTATVLLLRCALTAAHATPAFDEFLAVLGDRVPLQGFAGFRGGLDVTGAVCLIAC